MKETKKYIFRDSPRLDDKVVLYVKQNVSNSIYANVHKMNVVYAGIYRRIIDQVISSTKDEL
jgi:hypothetical protein